MPDFKKQLAARKNPHAPRPPLWKGPEVDGITFSMLSRFLVCRERFHALVVHGLKPNDTFSYPLEFGNLWHAAEEAHAADRDPEPAVYSYRAVLAERYPLSQETVRHSVNCVLTTFKEYVRYWKNHPDVELRHPVQQEEVFGIRYALPSGRVVLLKGKRDSVDLIKTGGNRGVWLQENKSKSSVDGIAVARQLKFDLQTGMYLVGVDKDTDLAAHTIKYGLAGVRYNVVKRSAHKQGIKETPESFSTRLAGIIREDPAAWFGRWNARVKPTDLVAFRSRCLDPILEQLCDWWNWVSHAENRWAADKFGRYLHWQHPFGVYNVLDEGGASDLDEFVTAGSTVGLQRVTTLFPELES